MVKIFVGNLSESTTKDELQDLFSQYGKITECDIVKNFGFVHMEKESEAEAAISNLNQYELNGQPMNVERSKGKSKGRNRGSTKLYVSNISSECTNQELRAKFEEYGPVAECDIVKDYAFVHMEREDDALRAINGLDNSAFQGKLMKVQLSTSRLRTVPGMGDHTGCYVCGKPGHWSKDCPHGQNGSYDNGGGFRGGRGYPAGPPGYSRGGPGMRGPSDYAGGPMYSRAATAMSRYPAYGAARDYGSTGRDPYASRVAPSYGDRYASAYERDRYSLAVDYYEKYRARPYASSYLDDRRIPPPPPPPPSAAVLMRMRSSAAALDPYERSSLGSSASAAAAAYYARDRSPTRRASTGSVGGTASYSYERSRLSPVARASPYSVPRAREAYGERERYAY